MADEKPKQNFLSYYSEYKDKIYNYLYYRVGFNQVVAEDLTSEVFIKALEHFEEFDQEKPFQAWIYRIAHNHLINHYKKSNRETELDGAENIFLEPLVDLDKKMEHETILTAMDELSDIQKQVVTMRYIEELEFSEISRIINKEEGAIRTQLSRAMNKLREIINQQNEKY